jgi:4-alpha-glucanotransferase
MNTPGTEQGNWQWRLEPGMLTAEVSDRLRSLTAITGRGG